MIKSGFFSLKATQLVYLVKIPYLFEGRVSFFRVIRLPNQYRHIYLKKQRIYLLKLHLYYQFPRVANEM
mgnify:CR=1 FL=1